MTAPRIVHALQLLAIAVIGPASALAQTSAPVSGVEYDVTYDSGTAPFRQIAVSMSFQVSGSEPVILSLPAWTPGSYELDNYARNVWNFSASDGDGALRWDKIDYDTWRVFPSGAGQVAVRFDYRADNLDTGNSWSAPDFVFFNGTNLFLFPEGRSLEFPARLRIHTEPGWRIATGMTCEDTVGQYVAADYHELVDMPTFIGRFDLDSAMIDGAMHHLATYPADALAGADREQVWSQLRGMMPPMAAVFGERPFHSYTTFMVFDPQFGGFSALEHRNSNLGVYTAAGLGSPGMLRVLGSVVSHEIFHAWNVKRLRPVEMVPYDYERPQPTTLLWVSEGITSYYGDLLLVRGQVEEPDFFYGSTGGQIDNVMNVPPVALEDASLTTWISPTDGTASIYYPKGALAGLLLDILIRDATDDRASLDDVMRQLYRTTYEDHFTGFSEQDWWDAVSRVAGGESFQDFWTHYVDGRDPYPWAEVLPLAGLRLDEDTTHRPLVGIYPAQDSLGVRVSALVPGGAAADGGVQEGDYLLSAGPVEISSSDDFDQFRDYFSKQPVGSTYEVVVRRGDQTLSLQLDLRLSDQVSRSIVENPDASPKAVRIRESLLTGQRG